MPRFKQHSVLPGFGLTLGFTVFYLALMVLVPLSGLFLKTATTSWAHVWETITSERVIASLKLSFGGALIGATLNAIFGFLVAWMLVRYKFFGKRIVDAVVDLPFALPTAVSGIALATVYSPNGWLGRWFEPLGIKTAYSQLGVVIALTFIGVPFVVRTLQPALEDLDMEIEEAAASLGANRFQTFVWVILPILLPPLVTGFALSFARAVGEYGSVIFIAGNMPMKTEITPLLIVFRLEEFDVAGATAIASLMLVISFALLLLINVLQWWSNRRQRAMA